MTNPTKHYKKADKFMRGIEKVKVLQYFTDCCDLLVLSKILRSADRESMQCMSSLCTLFKKTKQ